MSQAEDPERPYGRPFGPNPHLQQRPGLHVSCLPFLRDHDVTRSTHRHIRIKHRPTSPFTGLKVGFIGKK